MKKFLPALFLIYSLCFGILSPFALAQSFIINPYIFTQVAASFPASGLIARQSAIEYVAANNDLVVNWTDESGNNNPAHRPFPGNENVYKTNQHNGKSGITFDGVDRFLKYESLGSFDENFDAYAIVAFLQTDMVIGNGRGNWRILGSYGNGYQLTVNGEAGRSSEISTTELPRSETIRSQAVFRESSVSLATRPNRAFMWTALM